MTSSRPRVRAAQEMLEQSDHSIDWVASEVGFGNAATLRHHFGRSCGLSPQEYRRAFRMPALIARPLGHPIRRLVTSGTASPGHEGR